MPEVSITSCEQAQAVTIWPLGWSPGKIIPNLWKLQSDKMLCISPIQPHLKVNNLGVENGRIKPHV